MRASIDSACTSNPSARAIGAPAAANLPTASSPIRTSCIRLRKCLADRPEAKRAAPPVGSTLGQYGVNMMDFIQPFNDATKDMMGKTVTAHITVFEDRSMTFRVVAEATDDRIRTALGIKKGSL